MRSKVITGCFRIVVVFGLASAVLVCGSVGASTRAAKPIRGGTLIYLKGGEQALGWDPGQMLGVPTNSEVPGSFALYDTLLYEDPATGKLVGRLALSLTTTDAGVNWTLKLRPNVKFSDGTSFDAAAVQFNWQRQADPNTTPTPLRQPSVAARQIAAMQVVDPTTLKVTLGSQDPVWDRRVAYNLASIASPTALKALGVNYGTHPVGAGPFVLQDWVKTVQQTFVRNDSYWEKGRPYLDGITVKFITDDPQRLTTLQTGGGNVGIFFDPTFFTQAQQAGLKALPMSMSGGGWGIGFNNAKAPFDDVRMRQAISLAVDRKQFNDTRRPGNPASVINTVHRPNTTYYDKTEKNPTYDLAAAQKLVDSYVAEHGGSPVSVTFMSNNSAYSVTDAQQVQAQLQKLKNVNVSLDIVASSVTVQRAAAGDYQMKWEGFRWEEPAIDLVNAYLSTGSSNTQKYKNPAVDVLARQLMVATDLKEKQRLTHEIVMNLLKDVPNFWLTGYISTTVMDKSVKNWTMYFDARPLLDQVWLGKSKT